MQFFATKFEAVVTIDTSRREESASLAQQTEVKLVDSATVSYVDRIQMTMLKLTKTNKEILNLFGSPDEISLPDALRKAGECILSLDYTCLFHLMQRSDDLLNPHANCWLGLAHKYGFVLEKDLELAQFYFRVANSRGDIYSTMELIAHNARENDTEDVLKYVEAATSTTPHWIDQILTDYYPVGYSLKKVNSCNM